MKSNIHTNAPASSPLSFRLALQTELARRCAENPQYSLRAFAKYLGIDHSTLSQLLRGKRRFAEKTIRKISVRLGLEEAAIERWIHIEQRQGQDEATAGQVRQLTQDIASLMTDVNHYAILELTRIQGFQPDSRWIARVLGITVDEVNIAMQCLIRLGLLEMVSMTQWVDHLGDAMATMEDFTQAGIKRYLQQLHQLTLHSIESEPKERLVLSATTLAVNGSRVSAAIDMISRFREELLKFLASAGDHDNVYHLQLSFLPVIRLHKE